MNPTKLAAQGVWQRLRGREEKSAAGSGVACAHRPLAGGAYTEVSENEPPRGTGLTAGLVGAAAALAECRGLSNQKTLPRRMPFARAGRQGEHPCSAQLHTEVSGHEATSSAPAQQQHLTKNNKNTC